MTLLVSDSILVIQLNLSSQLGLSSGTAVFIFFILANNPLETISASTTTAANFTVDGFLEGSFSHWPNGSTPDFLFNYLAFSMAGMKDEMHQMIISTSDLSENVWVNFDYALYT